MIERRNIDREKLFFVLIRSNLACALVQRGGSEDEVLVELLVDSLEHATLDYARQWLLAEPDSAYMAEVGRWDYLREHCYRSANLYGPFMWAFCEGIGGELCCGFQVDVKNMVVVNGSVKGFLPPSADGAAK